MMGDFFPNSQAGKKTKGEFEKKKIGPKDYCFSAKNLNNKVKESMGEESEV
jgi:hypothetical protein